jgi:hypothetical protein
MIEQIASPDETSKVTPMDDSESWLADLSRLTLQEILTSTDPELLALIDRIVDQTILDDPEDGCC